jgi:hypothetical protein
MHRTPICDHDYYVHFSYYRCDENSRAAPNRRTAVKADLHLPPKVSRTYAALRLCGLTRQPATITMHSAWRVRPCDYFSGTPNEVPASPRTVIQVSRFIQATEQGGHSC